MIRSLIRFFSVALAALTFSACGMSPSPEAERLAASLDAVNGCELSAITDAKAFYDSVASTLDAKRLDELNDWLADRYDNRIDNAALAAAALTLKPQEAGERLARVIVEQAMAMDSDVATRSAAVESSLMLSAQVNKMVGVDNDKVVEGVNKYVNALPLDTRAKLLVRTSNPSVLGSQMRKEATIEEIDAVRALYTGNDLRLFEEALAR